MQSKSSDRLILIISHKFGQIFFGFRRKLVDYLKLSKDNVLISIHSSTSIAYLRKYKFDGLDMQFDDWEER